VYGEDGRYFRRLNWSEALLPYEVDEVDERDDRIVRMVDVDEDEDEDEDVWIMVE
jgi:hypothetical protein